ncbi:hypothetical protein ACE193_07880 [Bernardetia sp. OM2101]|uniref:hypothetical protein n=1 Tax=Bernardetia sp. OM2101 TaxID=3344876 RepID=UPI0035D020B4
MGLDIDIVTDNYQEIEEIYSGDFFHKHSLSRQFCNLMFREASVGHEAELDQIGKITNVDISIIYQIMGYPDEESLEFELGLAKTEEEKQKILSNAEEARAKLKNNLDKVLQIVTSLIEKLSKLENLNKLLLPTAYDMLDAEYYFSDFNTDKGDGYIGNNFGQDLRNFKRFLEFAKENGAKTVVVFFL